MVGYTSHSQSCASSPSPPSPLTPQRPLTPPPRRPRTPVTPAPSSPRVNTIPLPALSPGGPVPITITGPSTPIAGVFGMMGLNLEPSNWSIGSPATLPAGNGLGGHPGASLPNSVGGSGSGTPTRSFHQPQAISPAGLMALHNSFERYERDLERRWVVSTATSTPAASTPPSPQGSPSDLPPIPVFSSLPDEPEVEEQPTAIERPDGPPAEGEAVQGTDQELFRDDGQPSTSAPSQTQSSITLQTDSRSAPEPLILPGSTLLAFPLPTPQVLALEEVRLRRHDGVLTHWPAVTRVAGHTVIHRAVPGKPEESPLFDLEEGTPLYLDQEESEVGEPVDPSLFSTSPLSEPPLSLTHSAAPPVPSTQPGASLSLARHPSRPASPAMFGSDLAGPLAARIARSRATGTPEAWWAWGAPAIRAAAWGVLEDEPPVEAVTAAHPHSHASTTTETVTTTTTETRVVETADETLTTTSTLTETTTTTAVTSCGCNNSPITWGDGGGFTTRLGSFLFAPPFEEHEAAEMRVAAASAAAALTVCDGTCGCEPNVVESCEIHELDEGREVEAPLLAEDQGSPTQETPTERTPGHVLESQSKERQPQISEGTSGPPEDATKNHTEPITEPNRGLVGLSLSVGRAPIRLSIPFGTEKEKEKERDVAQNATDPTTPPAAPAALLSR